MIDFTTLQGLTIPEGVVTQITDESGRVIWAVSGGKVILQVEKITSDTYAGQTTYKDEEFILLDIYPKTNGTVNVTYGGLTKTITDTSGAEEPNAQQVFFGTFNGVTDSVATSASGKLTIDGDCYAFGDGIFNTAKLAVAYCYGITAILNFGMVEAIPSSAFGSVATLSGNTHLTSVTIPNSVTSIGSYAFAYCSSLTSVTIPNSVTSIGLSAFANCSSLTNLVVDSNNPTYTAENGVLFNKDKTILHSYPAVSAQFTIPNSVTSIGSYAFAYCSSLTSVTIPSNVKSIESSAFNNCNLDSISIQEGVVSIGENAFKWGFSRNTKLTIPSTVESVGEGAFGKFSSAKSEETLVLEVTLLPTTPPSMIESSYAESYGYGLFGDTLYVGTEDTLSIIVPKGTLDAYKSAKGWSEWAKYMKEAS